MYIITYYINNPFYKITDEKFSSQKKVESKIKSFHEDLYLNGYRGLVLIRKSK